MAGVRDKAHLGAVGLIYPVDHLVDGLSQRPQLLLGGGQVDAAVQVGGVDFIQLDRQVFQLPPGHVGHGVEPGGRGGQVLNRPEHLTDGPVAAEQVGQQGEPLADQDHHTSPVQAVEDAGDVHRDGVGLAAVGQLDGVKLAEVPGVPPLLDL